MSSNLEIATLSPQQRSDKANRQLHAMLGLQDLSPADHKLFTAAVIQAAAEEAESNQRFADRLKSIHEELLEVASKPKRARPQAHHVDLVPIGTMDTGPYDPYGPPDPYYLLKLYGPHQLAAALSRYRLPELKQALAQVEARNPGTKPATRTKASDIIDYIVAYVAG